MEGGFLVEIDPSVAGTFPDGGVAGVDAEAFLVGTAGDGRGGRHTLARGCQRDKRRPPLRRFDLRAEGRCMQDTPAHEARGVNHEKGRVRNRL